MPVGEDRLAQIVGPELVIKLAFGGGRDVFGKPARLFYDLVVFGEQRLDGSAQRVRGVIVFAHRVLQLGGRLAQIVDVTVAALGVALVQFECRMSSVMSTAQLSCIEIANPSISLRKSSIITQRWLHASSAG